MRNIIGFAVLAAIVIISVYSGWVIGYNQASTKSNTTISSLNKGAEFDFRYINKLANFANKLNDQRNIEIDINKELAKQMYISSPEINELLEKNIQTEKEIATLSAELDALKEQRHELTSKLEGVNIIRK